MLRLGIRRFLRILHGSQNGRLADDKAQKADTAAHRLRKHEIAPKKSKSERFFFLTAEATAHQVLRAHTPPRQKSPSKASNLASSYFLRPNQQCVRRNVTSVLEGMPHGRTLE